MNNAAFEKTMENYHTTIFFTTKCNSHRNKRNTDTHE